MVAQLRKELARIDLDPYDSVKDAVEEHRPEETEDNQRLLDSMKSEWRCKMPNCTGTLEIFLYSKLGNLWYHRVCSSSGCKNRTKSQKYDSNLVKGIIKG